MPHLEEDRALKAELVLCDENPPVLEALRFQFERHPDVRILEGSVIDSGADACVCPGNAFGFMDSGLALALSERFGWNLQDGLRDLIRDHFSGELLLGQAVVHATENEPAWLVYAPTVRTPTVVEGTLNAYLAMRGALLAVRDFNGANPNSPILSVAVSGLCTGVGGMHPSTSARQMRHAFELVMGRRGFGDKNLSSLARREAKLKSPPASARDEDEEGIRNPGTHEN